ncbi:hypothetical protein ATANTOWER_019235 [Ataeniobius toweri]|uniref:C-type lectin domain-containing protein n=1 Tax=Ataeniobius toweri TaxID=208326 RepID=A0ABU7ALP4_9TELE|nr:hypothetical protein [Ataeniobius toweri]
MDCNIREIYDYGYLIKASLFCCNLLTVHHCSLRMFKTVLLFLTLSGLQALPIADPRQRTSSTYHLPDGFKRGVEYSDIRGPVPDGFRQGTEPSRKFLVDLNTGLVKEHISEMDRRVSSVDIPAQKKGAGWVRMEKPSTVPEAFRQDTEPRMLIPTVLREGTKLKSSIPAVYRQGTEREMSIPMAFRQGTEPEMSIPLAFRQGTEPEMSIPLAFRQGTEPEMSIPLAFRQGTEPEMSIPLAFRQGTEPRMSIPLTFRQGTEPEMKIPLAFGQGTEPEMSIPLAFRQGTEPKLHIPFGFRQGTEPSRARGSGCKGELINNKCYEFNPKSLAFKDAQAFCRGLAPNAELASVTSSDIHSRLVSLVTSSGKNNPVLTWLGAAIKNQQPSWVDGSDWEYSDWMPGQPNIHTDKPVCVEMFQKDESWWTVADCQLKRASLCYYPVTTYKAREH